ncbi:phosphatidate cytidylyltransferase [Amphibacillus sp. MSJ-3]|uniref:phosphatidate cytidylyltransferase n=1 Tax=Amphibacillus sp. MSJ-3 TaxID=2841505 RepID=UPI001C0EBBBD|nr:phosphatidate cytidylyltransferase [Amphibacillus sp. MSJ-3]MBU5594992.1 phosphatidate cytidylyltransferase [Amphibacillus sp. MSJ-3]
MLKRTITAIVAILLFFPFVIIGGWPFYLVMLLISSIGLFELLRMRKMTTYKFPMMITMLLLWALLLQNLKIDGFTLPMIDRMDLLLITALLLLIYTVLVKNKFTFEDASFMLLGAVYIGLGFHYFIVIQEVGLQYIFYGIVVILATDTGAYFSGSLFGKNKLWPEISPKKTVEGALGGIVLATIAGLVYQFIIPVHDSALIVVVVSFTASIVGQMGDLVESAFKRHYDIKDSGRILPGHGGILDRFDSWLFVFPFLHFIYFVA